MADGLALLEALEQIAAIRFGEKELPNLKQWLAARPFPENPQIYHDGPSIDGKIRAGSYALFFSIFLVVLLAGLTLIFYFSPGKGKTLNNLRLAFGEGSAVISWKSEGIDEIGWSLSKGESFLAEGDCKADDEHNFKVKIAKLKCRTMYILRMSDSKREIGKIAFSVPDKRRKR